MIKEQQQEEEPIQGEIEEKDDSSTSSSEEENDEIFLGLVEEHGEDGDGEEDDDLFESKIGGKPLWLKWDDSLKIDCCGVCNDPLVLLAQIYAPLDFVDDAFHRFLYVFICMKAGCWKRRANDCVRVYRSQMRENEKMIESSKCRTCRVCGQPGSKNCSKCKSVRYCSKQHQSEDWNAGHKQGCSDDANRKYGVNVLLKELQIDTLKEVRDLKQEQNASEIASTAIASVKKPQQNIDENQARKADSVFLKFQGRTSLYPNQILRYSFGAKKPLWVME